MKLLRIIFTSFVLFTSNPVHSFVIELNEIQINSLMSVYFPLAFNYEQAEIQLTNANVTVKGENKRLQVTAHFKIQQSADFMIGTVTVDGQVAYDKALHKLQIIEPKLINADITESSFKRNDINDWLQKAFHHSLPIIVLLDFKQLNFRGLALQPVRVEVLTKSVLIEI
ncbi:DUF1439 domain-containing protein [Catenovulum maritimum]|uniref:DUF1439 domain-containing protein n=1 Tax=Catenovulum maritimum TaxID=1513271 RepID=A0A0J8GP34_9ALTE|nr:DUF1439 domain-containing protein [Catenovulum maritimum]KMT64522.1 hypothetical protein XM47_13760 [Catenovulum maritimum]